jgi:hypothetical protein
MCMHCTWLDLPLVEVKNRTQPVAPSELSANCHHPPTHSWILIFLIYNYQERVTDEISVTLQLSTHHLIYL